MKYFTKEWYQNCQKTIALRPLRINPKAGTYSEEFYQAVLYMRIQDECGQYKANEESYRETHKMFVELLRERLPDAIRQEIADVRVLELGVVTKENKRKLEKLIRMQRAEMDRPLYEYQRIYKTISEKIKKHVNFDVDNMSFHDSTVLSAHVEGNDFIIELESDYTPPENLRLILRNAKILKHESNYLSASWLYDEIYLINDGIELHVLFFTNVSDDNGAQLELKELILQASFIELTKKPKESS